MSHRFLPRSVLLLLLFLTGCASVFDGATQDVKFETPGAQDALCYAYVEGTKYLVRPPQTINLYKSGHDITVDCQAPGNRRKNSVVAPALAGTTAWNAMNAGVGAGWDYASGAMFRYPDVITIDFTGMPLLDSALPAQNNPDIRPPDSYDLEEFLPAVPRMNADKYKEEVVPLKRQKSGAVPVGNEGGAEAFTEGPKGPDKGDLQSVIKALNPSDTSTRKPTSLLPGQ